MRWKSISVVVAVVATTCLGVAGPSPVHAEAVQPLRVLDTRVGLGAPVGRLVPGQTLALPLVTATSPSATSVSLNLTVTDATAAGFLTAWPCGQAAPPTSILNYVPGQTVANFAAVGLGGGGVCLATSAPVHVVADVMGWFAGTADFAGAAPSRLLDSRVTRDPLKAGVERRLSVTKGAGYPGANAAVALNVTVVQPAADGFVTVYPCGPRPLASTVNYRAGEIVPNFTIVPYNGGEVCLYSMTDTEIVVDSFGWSSNTAGLQLATPSRLLDTRSGLGWSSGAAGPAQHVRLRVAGRGGVPNDAAAALLTITATGGTAEGFVTAWPCDQPLPLASVLNLRPNLLRSNLALLALAGSDGTVCLFASTIDGSKVHLVADVVGWVPGSIVRPPPLPDPPPPGNGSGHFVTLPVGAALPTDAECAAQVRAAPEVRAGERDVQPHEGDRPALQPAGTAVQPGHRELHRNDR